MICFIIQHGGVLFKIPCAQQAASIQQTSVRNTLYAILYLSLDISCIAIRVITHKKKFNIVHISDNNVIHSPDAMLFSSICIHDVIYMRICVVICLYLIYKSCIKRVCTFPIIPGVVIDCHQKK